MMKLPMVLELYGEINGGTQIEIDERSIKLILFLFWIGIMEDGVVCFVIKEMME